MSYVALRTLKIAGTVYPPGSTLDGPTVDGWSLRDQYLADGTIRSTGGGISATPIYTKPSGVIIASGDSGSFAVTFPVIDVMAHVYALTGTGPSVTFVVEELVNAAWVALWTSAPVTTLRDPAVISGSGTAGTTIGAGKLVDHVPGPPMRVRWVLGGTGPTATIDVSVLGWPS